MQRRSAGGLGSKGNAGLEGGRHNAKLSLDGGTARTEAVAASLLSCLTELIGGSASAAVDALVAMS